MLTNKNKTKTRELNYNLTNCNQIINPPAPKIVFSTFATPWDVRRGRFESPKYTPQNIFRLFKFVIFTTNTTIDDHRTFFLRTSLRKVLHLTCGVSTVVQTRPRGSLGGSLQPQIQNEHFQTLKPVSIFNLKMNGFRLVKNVFQQFCRPPPHEKKCQGLQQLRPRLSGVSLSYNIVVARGGVYVGNPCCFIRCRSRRARARVPIRNSAAGETLSTYRARSSRKSRVRSSAARRESVSYFRSIVRTVIDGDRAESIGLLRTFVLVKPGRFGQPAESGRSKVVALIVP